jgi:formylglycine-generating enzyme required for sulfatase activity
MGVVHGTAPAHWTGMRAERLIVADRRDNRKRGTWIGIGMIALCGGLALLGQAAAAIAQVVQATETIEGVRSAPAEPEPLTLTPLAEEREKALGPGDGFRECNLCPDMVVVPAGSFLMGSPETEPGREPSEGPQHRVTIARPFAVAKFAVTSAEWQACVRERGCRDDADDGWGARAAVTGPSWNDAQSYATWLSKRTGKTYRLLSEAEYEYAARGGTETAYAWGEAAGTGHADCAGCGSRSGNNRPAPVGAFAPNGFGLHDMTGNEQSFVEDCWHDTYDGAPSDGAAWTRGGDCGTRVVRGGSWASNPVELRSASRSISGTSDRYPIIGFRVARTLEP